MTACAPVLRQAMVATALALLGDACLALSCDELRAGVSVKIRAQGVQDFSVAIVDAGAAANGRVVGSCELGSKKLIYRPGPAQAAAQSAPVAPVAAAASRAGKPVPAVLTECADGRVITQGSCRK